VENNTGLNQEEELKYLVTRKVIKCISVLAWISLGIGSIFLLFSLYYGVNSFIRSSNIRFNWAAEYFVGFLSAFLSSLFLFVISGGLQILIDIEFNTRNK